MILTDEGGTLPLHLMSIFSISAMCLIIGLSSAYYVLDPMPGVVATGKMHDPRLLLRVDSLLVGSSQEVATGSW